MNSWLDIEESRRRALIENIEATQGIPTKAVEKDWWVTMVLRALFSCDCAEHIVFKGGTSLSKAWNLIERFSEDIDIAIDRAFFGFEGELKRKQISNLRRASCAYITNTLQYELDKQLQALGITGYNLFVPPTTDTTTDPQTIEVHYHSLFNEDQYIKDQVMVEIGARSLMEPSQDVALRSILTETYPAANFADEYVNIPTVVPQRTFLEKVFLLHEEFQKPINNIRVNRMSRHLYDIYKIMDTEYASQALADKALYNGIVEHRRMLTHIKEVDYTTHAPKTINFVPPSNVIDAWREDYNAMRASMIYGDAPSFDELIEKIRELNKRFRELA